jgi:integrase
MLYSRKQLPKYCRHKASGRAFVRIEGKMYYLGKYGSEASRREYDRIIAEFVARGRQPLYTSDEILVESLIIQFLNYTEREIQYSKSGKSRLAIAIQPLHELYGKTHVSAFTPTALKTLRQQFIERGCSRTTVNSYIGIIKQMFDWGCEEEIVSAEVAGALRSVKSLRAGRTAAADYDEIQPVDDAVIEKTLPYISQPYQDMVRIQRLISGRPQDIFNMRACDIDRSGEVWKYVPFTHKTKKHGKVREIPIGPKAQQILLRYLDNSGKNSTEFVFQRSNAEHYTYRYRDAIRSACKKAGVPEWTPNQLRHTGGTEVRDKVGLEYAQAVLGHSNAKTTEIYAKVAFDKAAKVAKEIG